MGEFRNLPDGGRREWTKEEMMAYLDWDREDTERVERLIEERVGSNGEDNGKRGIGDIWDDVDEDLLLQAQLHSS